MQLTDFVPLEIDLTQLAPMLIVAITGMLLLVWQMVQRKRDSSGSVMLSLLGLLASAALIVNQMMAGVPAFETAGGMILTDSFGLLMQLLIVGGTALAILFSEGYLREKRILFSEFYPLVLWSAVGAMLMASSRNLLMIFLGLEVLSIALYVMAGMSRSEAKSEESAMKYFLLGAFASAFLLYGIAFFFGASGSLHLDMVGHAWTQGSQTVRTLLAFGLGLALIGLSFKASFVPFHQWTPDVYQGAPTNVTAYMAVVSKIGAVAALWRVLDGALPMKEIWMPALMIVAGLTMTVGNLIALNQQDVKRILGYSSIAHAGYILVGVLAHFAKPKEIGATSVGFYLLSYLFMTAGAFAVVSLTAKDGKEGTKLADLHGLYKRSPFAAAALVVFVASLIGIPPAAGFFGKLAIFRDALDAGLAPLAILLAVNSVISLAYYLSIAKAAYVTEEEPGQAAVAKPSAGLLAACAVCVVGVLAGWYFPPVLLGFLGTR